MQLEIPLNLKDNHGMKHLIKEDYTRIEKLRQMNQDSIFCQEEMTYVFQNHLICHKNVVWD
jgi:hypothetical protein